MLLAYIYMLSPGHKARGDSLFQRVYAHRGLYTKDQSIPENSLAAFAEAIDRGYGIELDINITADGKVVVFHDDDLKRMCGVDKAVNDCSWAELSKFRLAGTDQGIPLFSEVLELVSGSVPLIVELKTNPRNNELCTRACELLDGYKGPYCIESFNPFIVRWFRKYRPDVVRGQLAGGPGLYKSLPFYQRFLLSQLLMNFLGRPDFVAYRHEDSGKKLRLRLFKRLGGRLVAWTLREPNDYKLCRGRFDTVIFEFFDPKPDSPAV